MEIKEYKCGCVVAIWQNEEGEIIRDVRRECRLFDLVNDIAPWMGEEGDGCQGGSNF